MWGLQQFYTLKSYLRQKVKKTLEVLASKLCLEENLATAKK